jgi:predicted dehydrogenase/threonine dehydrogenase-like Zn-dependent dehydrogenase
LKQIIQDLKSGKTILTEVPTPKVKNGSILIKSTLSLVSLGTEKMLVEFGKANFINKARQQPDKVKMAINKIGTDGLRSTLETISRKLDKPIPLGYSNVGVIEAIGSGVEDFKVGDRVVSNGNHAEFVCVPQNLVAKIPDGVLDEAAAFTVVGSIGLQGIRLFNPTFGETVVVIGLGLIGLITSELLIANGCNVIGIDFDPIKLEIAKKKGIITHNPNKDSNTINFIESHTNGIGADGVIIAASNSSNEIISQAAKMCRKRGRIILIGVVGLDISRSDFYEKEITFQVSCSYGPGRYDDNYEHKGQDYPIGFVRWTEKRNFEAILTAIDRKQIETAPLITKRVELNDYSSIYDDLSNKKSIASLINYNKKSKVEQTVTISNKTFEGNNSVIGIVGAGNFTSAILLPTLYKLNANINYIASSQGLSSSILAKKYKIKKSTTDYDQILSDIDTNLVIITTRHNTHAKLVMDAIKAKKNIFVEKPLAINEKELKEIIKLYNKSNVKISIGFNRRFSPLAKKMKSIIGQSNSPINLSCTINAGMIPNNSWLHDMEVGGGRIIGEACHFIDLFSFLTGSNIKEVCMNGLGKEPKLNTDNASLLIRFENGSNGVINYFSNGSKSYPKERIEVFSDGKTIVIDNWRTLTSYGVKSRAQRTRIRQDKGHYNLFSELIKNQNEGETSLISFEEIINTTRSSFALIESLKENSWVKVK